MLQILIIDDDYVVQLMLLRMLEKQGYEIITASNGEIGMAQAEKFRPALIICDWMMPRMDGLEVCRQIKADPVLCTTFFILFTSLGSVADRVKGLDAGADDFITKPIDENELKARVRAGLRLHQMSHDLQVQKQLLEAEMAEAAKYVRSLLPPAMSGAITIDSRFISSQQLGGDCFDYYWLDSDHLVIYLLSSAGHGLKAALKSATVLNLLRFRTLAQLDYYQPRKVLEALNHTFASKDQNDKHFTIWYGVYNCVKRQLIYASAGHPPAVLLAQTKTKLHVEQLQTAGLPIGMFPEVEYFNSYCSVKESSTLYVFSAGAYNIKQQDGVIWDSDAFINLLRNRHQQECHLDEILEELTALSYQNSNDDLSIIQTKFD